MPDLGELLKIAISLFAIVDPIGSVPLFLSATHGWSRERRADAARVAAVTVFVVLGVVVFLGESILSFFGISLASFSVGGGILLLLLAISMMQAQSAPMRQTEEEAEEAVERESVGVVPLGIPLLAGPGAITQVIIASHDSGDSLFLHQTLLLLPIALVALAVWLTFRAAMPLAHRLGATGIHIVTRIMGLMIAAISVEMIARGLLKLFPGLAG
ncbi:MAG: NAAT family transporter [Thiobacillaceae bacterium]|jgi:multiple antibiotic resistance protein|nr:NAAT family transporter [Thiobacillaceae bacterium]